MAAWFIDALPYSRFEILSREKTFANFASRQQFVTAVLSAKIRTLNRRGTLKIVQTSYELFFATGKLAQIWCFHDAQFVMPVFYLLQVSYRNCDSVGSCCLTTRESRSEYCILSLARQNFSCRRIGVGSNLKVWRPCCVTRNAVEFF